MTTPPGSHAAQRPGVSIVVCCHDSAERITPALQHLAAQNVSGSWEVVVVDNASTDGTAAIADKVWIAHGAPTAMRVIREPRRGLAFAREAGTVAAAYEYVIFCDDDNWLSDDYAERVSQIMRLRPDVGVAGGRSEPAADAALPPWFWTYAGDYAVGAQAPETGDITARGYVWGAGMAIRRSVFLRLLANGANSLLIDRRGRELQSGGDAELSMWYIAAGYRLWYDEQLRFRHYLSPHRLTVEYLRDLHRSFVDSERVLARYRLALSLATEAGALKRAKATIVGLGKWALRHPDGTSSLEAALSIPGVTFDEQTRRTVRTVRAIRRAFRIAK